jgi:hypothetical protein
MHSLRIISCSAEVKQVGHFTIKDPVISYLNYMTAQESIVTRENICVQQDSYVAVYGKENLTLSCF